MFKNLFHFKGRIRRLEYCLSYIFYIVILNIGSFLAGDDDIGLILYYIIFFAAFWFLLSQGAKRCHDLGNSGFYQLIPFYVLWLWFADGEPHPNKYGENPKNKNTQFNIDDIGKE